MKGKSKKVYIRGKGFMDVSKNILSKIISIGTLPAQNLLKSALNSGSKIAGDKIGSFVADKITDKLLPKEQTNDTTNNIKAIEELENKIKKDIENFNSQKIRNTNSQGMGFKKI